VLPEIVYPVSFVARPIKKAGQLYWDGDEKSRFEISRFARNENSSKDLYEVTSVCCNR